MFHSSRSALRLEIETLPTRQYPCHTTRDGLRSTSSRDNAQTPHVDLPRPLPNEPDNASRSFFRQIEIMPKLAKVFWLVSNFGMLQFVCQFLQNLPFQQARHQQGLRGYPQWSCFQANRSFQVSPSDRETSSRWHPPVHLCGGRRGDGVHLAGIVHHFGKVI